MNKSQYSNKKVSQITQRKGKKKLKKRKNNLKIDTKVMNFEKIMKLQIEEFGKGFQKSNSQSLTCQAGTVPLSYSPISEDFKIENTLLQYSFGLITRILFWLEFNYLFLLVI